VPAFPPSAAILIAWLIFHRIAVHGGVRDLFDARKGTSPFTTWAVVIETFLLSIVAVTGAFLDLREPSMAVMVGGNVLMVTACGIGMWARRTLGRHFSIHLTTDQGEGHQLVTSGPYRWVRHPVYTGDLLFQIAVPLITCTYEALVFAPIYFLIVRARMGTEERMLSEEYADYGPYMESTWRLFPRVY